MKIPERFHEWWQWGIDQADASRAEVPSRIHQQDFPKDSHPGRWSVRAELEDGTRGPGTTIGPPPFTPEFENYLDGEPEWGPMRRAMARLSNRRSGAAQIHEYRILHALLEGHVDSEVVRALIGGCRRDFFEAAALRAFRIVMEIAKQDLPLTLTPPARSVSSSQQPNTRRIAASPNRPERHRARNTPSRPRPAPLLTREKSR